MTCPQIALVSLVLALAGGLAFVGYQIDFAQYLATDRLVTLFREAGALGPVILILCMVAAVVISPIPSLPIDLAAGAAYGPVWGTTYAVTGALIGAVISFLIARILGRDLVEKLFRTQVRFCEQCSDSHLTILVLLARLVPVFSFDIISYGAGLTNMSVLAFAGASLAGMIPPTLAFTYFGSSVVAAQWVVVVGGAAMVAVFILTPRLVLRYSHTWWAQFFLAASPAEKTTQDTPPPFSSTLSVGNCSGCGRSLR